MVQKWASLRQFFVPEWGYADGLLLDAPLDGLNQPRVLTREVEARVDVLSVETVKEWVRL